MQDAKNRAVTILFFEKMPEKIVNLHNKNRKLWIAHACK